MVLSQSGQEHVTCCCIHVWVLTNLYSLQLSQCHFLNISEGQHSLNNASKDLPCVWCIHSSSSRIDWQHWEPHNSCQWWLLQRTNWYRHQSNSHSRSFGFSLIALFLVYSLSGSLFFYYMGQAWCGFSWPPFLMALRKDLSSGRRSLAAHAALRRVAWHPLMYHHHQRHPPGLLPPHLL